ncbi:MAG: RNA methyltransferase [Planctomycetota bacterium]
MKSGELISSKTNASLKRIGAARRGKLEARIVLEGARLVEDALQAGARIETLFVAMRQAAWLEDLEDQSAVEEARLVEDSVFDASSGLEHSPGILALAHEPVSAELTQVFEGSSEPLVVAVAGVADPGNLGALARSAEALGAKALLVARGGCSPWNEKALRGSMGSLLRLPIVHGRSADELGVALANLEVRQVAAATRGGESAEDFDWSGSIALWVGAETGDDLFVQPPRLEPVTLAMEGAAESFNVTVAASLLLYESRRARRGVR